MYIINPGEFKHRFELQELKIGIDADNIPTKQLTTILMAKCRVRNNVASNKELDNGERTAITKIITARYPKHLVDFDVEDANRYKILYNNKTYEVISMSNIREENKYLQINIGVTE